MKCSSLDNGRMCGKHATQVILAICRNEHIKEQVFCDMHASDRVGQIRERYRICIECGEAYEAYLENEIHPGYKI